MPNTAIPRLEPDIAGNHGGARLIVNGRKCSFSSVRSYVIYNNLVYGENKDPAEAEQRELKKPGGQLYWINLESTVICGDKGYYEREAAKWADAPQLNAGDIVEYDGKHFRIEKAYNGNFRPVQVHDVAVFAL